MPIYEFHCSGCNRDSEVLVQSSRWKGTPCPHCGSKKLDKKLSVFASAIGGSNTSDIPACGATPGSCKTCCGGGPHRH